MAISIARRIGVEMAPALRTPQLASKRNLSLSFAKSDNLVSSIVEALRNGRTVVLLDVDYRSPLFGQTKTIEQDVIEELISSGANAELADKVINLDHHNREMADKTSTEIVLENLEMLRRIKGEIEIFINHGDTDSMVASFVANHLDRTYSDGQTKLLIAAARAGDHTEGDFISPYDNLAQPVRLNLALDTVAQENGLEYRIVWKTSEDQIKTGLSKAYQLIEASITDTRVLYTKETETLIGKNPVRISYQVVKDALAGKAVNGVSVDKSIDGYPIVTVDVSTAGLDDFNPHPAYQTTPPPAIILIARNGRIVGVGRNNKYSPWLNLLGSSNVKGFYERTDLRLKGGAHAGGANVPRDAFDSLPSPAEAVKLAKQFLRESINQRNFS